ncbi:hypothetical protein QN355_20255, partial [Cryobacterium sp. 10S3]
NLLSSLGFNFPASTTALFAADNRISVFPELPLHNLRILSLDRNRIGAWPQYFAPYLRELYVSGNLLSEFPPDLPSELAILS